MEFHPRLDPNNLLLSQNRIILGSFPVWSLTPSKNKQEQLNKDTEKLKNGDFDFFYGSSTNKFWGWYAEHINHLVERKNPSNIELNLKNQGIGITDIILCCERKGKSALDKDLSKRKYNHQFFKYPSKGEILKILCTSKGILNEMLLCSSFFKLHPSLQVDKEASLDYQEKILSIISGKPELVKKPFFITFSVANGGLIECFALPSPGSPMRKLKEFGLAQEDNSLYLEKFLLQAFAWFKS